MWSPGISAPYFTRVRLIILASLCITWIFGLSFRSFRPAIEATFKSRLEEARRKIPSIKIDWPPAYRESISDPRLRYNGTKVALLIEPRPLPQLVPQLLHMISVVPQDWRFVFIGSKRSVVQLGRPPAIKHQQGIGKLDLMVLPEPWEIDSKEKVYRVMTDGRFYDEFLPGVEWVLKYEYDSLLCANSQQSLNDWLEFDWAGAARNPNDRFSGNGGLTLRKVSTMKRVLKFQVRQNDTQPEDEWYGQRVITLPKAKVANGEEQQLAVEDIYRSEPMGYHVRDGGKLLADGVWKDPKQRKTIFTYCPELSMIMDMKFERERCPGDDLTGHIPEASANDKQT